MPRDRNLKNTFEDVSSFYDEARASYPEQLVEDIISFSGVSEDSSLLEVGCGSGKATILFARKEFKIHAIDISADLIRVARKKTSQFSRITYEVIFFEEKPLEKYDLILSAQAWHWVDPRTSYEKAFEMLTEKGTLALFWKNQEYDKLPFLMKLRELYLKHCPGYHDPCAVKDAEEEIPKSNFFQPLKKKQYFLELQYDKQTYKQMVSTMS